MFIMWNFRSTMEFLTSKGPVPSSNAIAMTLSCSPIKHILMSPMTEGYGFAICTAAGKNAPNSETMRKADTIQVSSSSADPCRWTSLGLNVNIYLCLYMFGYQVVELGRASAVPAATIGGDDLQTQQEGGAIQITSGR